jgi:hypothetical protein
LKHFKKPAPPNRFTWYATARNNFLFVIFYFLFEKTAWLRLK